VITISVEGIPQEQLIDRVKDQNQSIHKDPNEKLDPSAELFTGDEPPVYEYLRFLLSVCGSNLYVCSLHNNSSFSLRSHCQCVQSFIADTKPGKVRVSRPRHSYLSKDDPLWDFNARDHALRRINTTRKSETHWWNDRLWKEKRTQIGRQKAKRWTWEEERN